MTRGTVTVLHRPSRRSWSLVLERAGERHVLRTGVRDHGEAVKRARVWCDHCGYRLRDRGRPAGG